MRKLLRILLLTALLAAALCITAAAADISTVDGVYNVQGTGATLNFYTADGTSELSTSKAYVTETDKVDMYEQAVRFDVEATGGTANSQYLLLVCSDNQTPSADNIVYINQAAADSSGNISFTGDNKAYPKTMVQGNYYVYIVGNGKTYDSTKTAAENAAVTFQTYSAYTLGDVDENGSISGNDALFVLQAVAKTRTLTGNSKLAADTDKNGSISGNDALYILQAVAKTRTL